MTPARAAQLSIVHLAAWLFIPLSIVTMMVRSGGPHGLGGLGFLALIVVLLGGVGVFAGALGLFFARRAQRATDPAAASRGTRASIIANAAIGALQIAVFATGLMMLTQLHH